MARRTFETGLVVKGMNRWRLGHGKARTRRRNLARRREPSPLVNCLSRHGRRCHRQRLRPTRTVWSRARLFVWCGRWHGKSAVNRFDHGRRGSRRMNEVVAATRARGGLRHEVRGKERHAPTCQSNHPARKFGRPIHAVRPAQARTKVFFPRIHR